MNDDEKKRLRAALEDIERLTGRAETDCYMVRSEAQSSGVPFAGSSWDSPQMKDYAAACDTIQEILYPERRR